MLIYLFTHLELIIFICSSIIFLTKKVSLNTDCNGIFALRTSMNKDFLGKIFSKVYIYWCNVSDIRFLQIHHYFSDINYTSLIFAKFHGLFFRDSEIVIFPSSGNCRFSVFPWSVKYAVFIYFCVIRRTNDFCANNFKLCGNFSVIKARKLHQTTEHKYTSCKTCPSDARADKELGTKQSELTFAIFFVLASCYILGDFTCNMIACFFP